MSNIYYVDDDFEGVRVDKYLGEILPDISRSYIQKLLKSQHILVNKCVCKANYKVKTDDIINVDIPEPLEANIVAEDIPLDIIYEDDDILIVNKPKDMVVHPAPGHYTRTLVNALMYHCRDNLSEINGVLRPGIVHRIDKDTTGALIVCKNDYSHNFISQQLKVHSITRKYVGIVQGRFDETEGVIDAPIGRHPNNRKQMCINEKNGRDAVTHYRVLERFRQFTYVECRLETGRTHQIRVHLSHHGHPIVGDPLYNPARGERLMLHAHRLTFTNPLTLETIQVEAPSKSFEEGLKD